MPIYQVHTDRTYEVQANSEEEALDLVLSGTGEIRTTWAADHVERLDKEP